MFLWILTSVQFVNGQSVTINTDDYKQKFIGVGGSAGNYFETYFKNSSSEQAQIMQWLAGDLHYKLFKSYDGNNHPTDRPDYYDERARFFKDLKNSSPDVKLMICMNQISEMYASEIENDQSGIYKTVAQRYFDIIEAYHERNATVDIIELLNEPGGKEHVLTKGKVYAYAVPELEKIINDRDKNPNGVPMPEIAGPATWGVGQCPYWIKKFKRKLSDAWSNIDIVTTHGYNQGWKTELYQEINDMINGKPFYNSEQTGKSHQGDDIWTQEESGAIPKDVAGALSICQRLTAGMNGGLTAFMAFQNYNTSDNSAALLKVNKNSPPETKKMYHAFKQVTAIQPDKCHRVEHEASNTSKIRTLTMRKKGENYVYVHLTNINADSKSVKLVLKDKKIKGIKAWLTDKDNNAVVDKDKTFSSEKAKVFYTLPAHSVVTVRLELGSTRLKDMTSPVEEMSVPEESFTCYPNPASDELTVLGMDNVSSIEVYNMLGKKLIENQGSETIIITELPGGVYMVRVNGEKTVKFMKK